MSPRRSRLLSVWIPDWSAIAVGLDSNTAGVVIEAGKVFASTTAARSLGVTTTMALRSAQAKVPELVIKKRNTILEARFFEPVIQTLEDVSPYIEVTQAGECCISASSVIHQFDNEEALVHHIRQRLLSLGLSEVGIGIADTYFCASRAARRNDVVAPAHARSYLAPLSVWELQDATLAKTLTQLGIRTLGVFADLETSAVSTRFGPSGTNAHGKARAVDELNLSARTPTVDIGVSKQFDGPVATSDQLVFLAKQAAEELMAKATQAHKAVRVLAIVMFDPAQNCLERVWRHDQHFDATDIATRARWMTESWIASHHLQFRDGITELRLEPLELCEPDGDTVTLWEANTNSEANQRAGHALARVQSILGPDAVKVATVVSARHHAHRVHLHNWPDPQPDRAISTTWTGQLPRPTPASLPEPAWPAAVLSQDLELVVINKRGWWNHLPHFVRTQDQDWRLSAYSRPWPHQEKWWDGRWQRRCVYMQALANNLGALLLCFENQAWTVVGLYD